MLAVLLALFLLASVGTAAAPGAAVLVTLRALQGVAGGVMPLSVAITRDEAPAESAGLAIGALTAAFGAGAAAGLGVAGPLATLTSWRAVFAVGSALIAAGLAVVWFLVPPSPNRTQARIDLPGALLLGGGLAAILVGLAEGGHEGWSSPLVLGLWGGGAAAMAAWVARSLLVPEPLVDLRLFRQRPLLLANAASFLIDFVLFGIYFLIPHFVEHGRGAGFGAGLAAGGLYLLPAAAALVVAGPLSGLAARRGGARLPFVAGAAAITAGAGLLAHWHGRPSVVLAELALLGAGFGLATGAVGMLVSRLAPADSRGIAVGMNGVLRMAGGGLGSQISAAVLASATVVTAAGTFTALFWTSCGVGAVALGLVAALPA